MTGKLSLRGILLALLGVLVLYYIVQDYQEAREDRLSVRVQNGVIDLSNREFDAKTFVKLDGDWEFYWNRLVSPDQEAAPTGYYPVPGHWRGVLNGEALRGKGTATYRLVVKVKPDSHMYGIRISNIQMASTVYVNGVKVGGSGIPALSREEYEPENRPYTVNFPMADGRAEIVVQAANYNFIQGGIPYSLYFGTDQAIIALDKRKTIADVTVVIAILMLGLYHIGAYFSRRDLSLLYLSLYCVAAAIGFSSISDKLFMQLFAGWLPFELSYKIQVTAVYFQIVMMLQFLKQMCPELIPRWLIRAGTSVFLAGFASVVLLPHRIYSYYTFGFSALQLVVYLIIISILSASYRRGWYGSFSKRTLMMTILAFCGLCVCLFDSTAYLMGLVPDNQLGNAAILFFGVTISLMLSLRYAEAFAEIETISQQLREADRLKDQFLIHTSHEFQTPLNGVINISASLLEGGPSGLSDRQRQSLAMIVALSRRLSGLVNDIMDMEKVKRGELRLQAAAVDIGVVVSVVLDMFSYLTFGKTIRLAADIPDDLPLVHADENRLTQVMYNLLGNAVKFTDQGQVVIAVERSGDRIHVTVQDTGIGIPRDRWERIFTPFEQGDNRISDEYGGVGLGLPISRQLIELMGGEIRVEWSETGKGTRIGFDLPVTGTGGGTARARPQPPLRSAKRVARAAPDRVAAFTLLAVDDEPSNLQVLASLFEKEGWRVLTATNGLAALDLLQAERGIDLVLLDVMMPRMSGYEACRHIRRQYSLFELPVVMLTVRTSAYDLTAGFEAGANDFIVKPFEAGEVRARVGTLLTLKKAARDALAAEMAFLQSQIKPHFLFNTLNSILSLCYTDSAKAAQLISHLGRYLKKSFDIPGTQMFVGLRDELQLVQAYVEIEKARFEERLVVEYEIDPGALAGTILPLTIQPLVENAIRHGVMRKEEGGIVQLTVKKLGDAIRVEIGDNGVGIPAERLRDLMNGGEEAEAKARESGGIGLINIHRRLVRFYGAGLQVSSAEGEWTRVSFLIVGNGEVESDD